MKRVSCIVVKSLVVLALMSYSAVFAKDRVVIMTISEYPGKPLAGVKHDEGNGLSIAEKMGYDTRDAVKLRDQALTLAGMKAALENLVKETRRGDRVFVYYSGHGGSSKRNGVCEQSLVTVDEQYLFSSEMTRYLQRLKDTASKVTVFMDACHSGGVIDKAVLRSLAKTQTDSFKPKSFTPRPGEDCAKPVNFVASNLPKTRSTRAIVNVSNNYTYIVAARDNEHALDSPKSGGLASTSVIRCLNDGIPSGDNSGIANVDDLVRCAQGHINTKIAPASGYTPHHISVISNKKAPIFGAPTLPPISPMALNNAAAATAATAATAAAASAPSMVQPSPAPMNTDVDTPVSHTVAVPAKPPATPVSTPVIAPVNAPANASAPTAINAVNTLKRIAEGQDARWNFKVKPTSSELAIGGTFQIRYTSTQPGYVYVLYVGSDGKEFKQLYPISAGDKRYLSSTEGYVGKDGKAVTFTVQHPPGDNHFLVLLTESPKDFSDVFGSAANNLTAAATGGSASNLGCVVAGLKQNADAGEAATSCTRSRNVSAQEGSDAQLTGYGAATFVVKGEK